MREILSLSGFDQLIPVHDDEGTAVAFLVGVPSDLIHHSRVFSQASKHFGYLEVVKR